MSVYGFIRNRIIDYKEKKLNKKFLSIGKNSMVIKPDNISGFDLISIGENTTILPHARINTYEYLVEKEPHIIIGNHCYFGYYLSILAGADITIEDNVLIASHVMIVSENHGMDPESEIPYMDQPISGAPVKIGEGSWIGEKACILPGVTIGKKCVISAGCIVTKDIPDYSIAVGNPARVIKRYNFESHSWENRGI